MGLDRGNEMKTIVLGSVAAIAAATLVFGVLSQTVKGAESAKTQAVPTRYSIPYTGAGNSDLPPDYVKKEYQVKLVGKDQPTVNDLKLEEAAELAAQQLWRVFAVDLSDRTLEMTYNPASTTQQRAIWSVAVKISDTLLYEYALDAVTGEHHLVAKRIYHHADIPEGMDKSLITNHEEYQALAKKAAEAYRLVSDKVAAVEYISQGYQEDRAGAKNSSITLQVKSDKGEVAQLSFSRYNQELLAVEFSSWLKEAEAYQVPGEPELKALDLAEQRVRERTPDLLFDEKTLKEVRESGKPILIEK
ncbi:hypothetical protein [Paenibacillus puerhi]|uniref:hypothetical protein n=1 Tax=Paenibacillus puerhi TaxID=2692622 RepID=UPI00135CEEAE|nr:hypothetical protein [Paenibacillus puerhi]